MSIKREEIIFLPSFQRENERSNLTLTVTKMIGQVVSEQKMKVAQKGLNKLTIDASSLKPGIYFYTVKAGNSEVTRKMIVE